MHVLSCINMKGGVAKTTLCINVADFLARRDGKRVLVIDIDPQFNATQCLVAPETYEQLLKTGQHNIVDVFDSSTKTIVSTVAGVKAVEPIKLGDIKPIKIRDNLHLLPGNLDLYKLEMAPGKGREHRLKKYLESDAVKDSYDYVLIDTPPTPSVWMSSALLASRYYLIPVKPDPISFTGIDLLKKVVDELKDNYGAKLSCVGVVLTIAEPQTIVYQRCVEYLSQNEYWKGYLYKEPLPKKTIVPRSQAAQGMILDSNDSDLKFALSKIVANLRGRIEAPLKGKK